jgi:predicted Zn finger-like uncharacterized protein
MRIACPNCSAEYEVPDTLLAGGPRLLRCARCSHRFEAAPAGTPPPAATPAAEVPAPPAPATESAPAEAPPAPEPEPPPAAEPAPAPAPEASRPVPEPAAPPAPPPRPPRLADPLLPHRTPPEPARGATPLVLAWLLSLAILGAAGWATWHYQAEIVEAWPPAARLYQALGVR